MQETEWIVISVGGSLIVPDDIDIQFLRSFKTLVETYSARGTRFAIIAGGGKTARRYQHAADAVSVLTREDLDWLGIHSTRLNGHLLRTIFKDIAHPVVLNEYEAIPTVSEQVMIHAGGKPGRSSDFCAVTVAEHFKANRVINLSNVDYVYDKDPREFPDAERFETLSWEKFRELIPKEWDPGLSSPFDPVASKKAHELGLEVAIINGAMLPELENYLQGEKFVGTVIS